MSFNIRYGTANDGEHHWSKRKVLVAKRIHAFEPDLLGLQECRDDSQAAFIKTNLPAHLFYGQRREGDGDSGLEMVPILYRESAFQKKRSGHFWLSETPELPGNKSWESNFPRTVTWATLIHQPTSQTVTYVNTHFDFEPTAIDKAAQLLRKWLDQIQEESAVIVTGDFNTDKDSSAYHRLTGNGKLFDAYRAANPASSNEATLHGFGRLKEPKPIDWILVSEHFRVMDASIDNAQEGTLYPSDHYPIWAKLEWKSTV